MIFLNRLTRWFYKVAWGTIDVVHMLSPDITGLHDKMYLTNTDGF